MGFFSDLKNKVTGGAATVQVNAPQVRRGQPAAIQIQATAKSNGSVNGVYLLVRASELAQVRDTDYDNGKRETEIVKGRRVSFETKINVTGAFKLEQGQSYTWDAQLELPGNVNASFNGKMIDHVWEIQAGLDMTGNDPDSGWQTINVS